MAYTFLKAQGKQVGRSLIEEELVPLATSLLKDYSQKIVLPIDTIAAAECSEDAPSLEVAFSNTFPSNYEGLDIGPQTLQLFSNILKDAQTILWNGPVGVYELDRFAHGTLKLTQFISDLNAKVIVGGGDLIAAVNKAGVSEKLTHISTGGGATLEYIEFGTLPSIEALSEKPVPTQ
ncbi:MAG: Phosphoglycerate kinase [Chlamydiales bacterium]|nr:Phosphoglycerate kinase [Chlamydiales bacterium]